MTGFKGKINLNGRPKGSVNKTTAQTKELLQKVVGKELDKLGTLLSKLDPAERINAIAKLLPYILPRSIEVKAEVNTIDVFTPEQREARIKFLNEKMNSND